MCKKKNKNYTAFFESTWAYKCGVRHKRPFAWIERIIWKIEGVIRNARNSR